MAGTITLSIVKHQVTHDPLIKELVATCVADSGAATFPSTSTDSQNVTGSGNRIVHTFSREIRGWFLSKIGVNPGGVAPTVNSSVYMNDSNGVDLLGGAGETIIHNTSSLEGRPLVKGFPCSQPVTTALTLVISRNAINSASLVVTFTLTREPY